MVCTGLLVFEYTKPIAFHIVYLNTANSIFTLYRWNLIYDIKRFIAQRFLPKNKTFDLKNIAFYAANFESLADKWEISQTCMQ